MYSVTGFEHTKEHVTRGNICKQICKIIALFDIVDYIQCLGSIKVTVTTKHLCEQLGVYLNTTELYENELKQDLSIYLNLSTVFSTMLNWTL